MKAVILVGGYGTRLRPLTFYHPKPMLPFVNKPIIEHQIKALASVGVSEVILAISFQPQEIASQLGKLEDEVVFPWMSFDHLGLWNFSTKSKSLFPRRNRLWALPDQWNSQRSFWRTLKSRSSFCSIATSLVPTLWKKCWISTRSTGKREPYWWPESKIRPNTESSWPMKTIKSICLLKSPKSRSLTKSMLEFTSWTEKSAIEFPWSRLRSSGKSSRKWSETENSTLSLLKDSGLTSETLKTSWTGLLFTWITSTTSSKELNHWKKRSSKSLAMSAL